MNERKTYRVLSIDGGGLRGIIPLAIMVRLDGEVPGWRNNINMFAGTSTGGLIALALAKGKSPSELLDIYVSQGGLIFDRSLWHEITNIDDLTGPKYDSTNRENICKEILENSKLGDLVSEDGNQGHVVITSFDLDDKTDPNPEERRWKAKIFHNLPTSDSSGDDLEYCYRIAMRTSAAPTYFASYDGFVDGGVFANNPSMCALAQTQDRRLRNSIPLQSVRLLSLATGFFPYHLKGDESWGLAQWAPHMVDLLTDGVNEVAAFQTAQMLGKQQYCRLPVRLQADIRMDDASKVGVLQRIGNRIDISTTREFVTSWQQ